MTSLLKLEDVSKRYVKYHDLPLLLSRMKFRARSKKTFLWALKNVSLDVAPGETFGVIGRNGSGKSTMLRLLAGVTAPTSGLVAVHGRVAPLISVGVGFHPELTGRENVYVNGSILGLSRRRVEALFDGIVAFAELEDFIDTPVKFYSSGMFVRLGFSVAVASAPDVLLVDEVLAVGDFAFQQKCYDRIAEIQAEGTAVVVVSHNVSAIRRLCSRVIVLHRGENRFTGPVEEGILVYTDLLAPQHGPKASGGDVPVEVAGLEMFSPDGRRTAHAHSGEERIFRLEVRFLRDVERAAFGISLRSEGGHMVYQDTTVHQGGFRRFSAGETAVFEARLPLQLTNGGYIARGGFSWGVRPSERLATVPLSIFVSGRRGPTGLVDLHAAFSVDGGGAPANGPVAEGGDPFADQRAASPNPEPSA